MAAGAGSLLRGTRVLSLSVSLMGVLAAGCAHVRVDAEGNRHVLGFAAFTLPAADASGGSALRSRVVGLSFTSSEAGSAFVLGYSDATVAFVRNDAVVSARALLLPQAVPFCRRDVP